MQHKMISNSIKQVRQANTGEWQPYEADAGKNFNCADGYKLEKKSVDGYGRNFKMTSTIKGKARVQYVEGSYCTLFLIAQ